MGASAKEGKPGLFSVLPFNLNLISKIVDQGSGQGVPQIENGAYTQYVSISIFGTTQPWTLRRIFEIKF